MLNELTKTAQFFKAKKIILYPTDTVWGIGCDATSFDAVSKIYQLKKRKESKSLILLVSSLSMLKKYVYVPENVFKILKKSTKPTTIVYHNPKNIAKNCIALDGTVAIRIVEDDFCRKLIKRLGKPIVSTPFKSSNSGNISGSSCVFSKSKKPIDGFLDNNILFNSSTIRSFVIIFKRSAFFEIACKELSSIVKFN